MSTYFPPLTDDQLVPIKVLVGAMNDQGIGILDEKGCPYDKKTVAFLKSLVPDTDQVQAQIDEAVETALQNATSTPTQMHGLSGTEHLITELGQVYHALGSVSVQGKDKVQVEKAKIAAIEKIVGLKERLLTLKQLTEFQSTVMLIMEQVLEPEQREEFLTKLQEAVREG